MTAYFGARARLGLIVPPNNTVVEAEWALAAPPGVSMHATRFRLNPLARSAEELTILRAGLEDACRMLGEAELKAIAFGCTAPSAISPRASLETFMQEASGLPSATAAAAVVDGLLALGARRPILISPFSAAVTDHESAFLASEGLEVVAAHSLGHATYAPGRRIEVHRIAPETIAAFVAGLDRASADAIVLSGTNLVTFPILAALERDIGLPFVSSNQALLWSTLRKAGVRDELPFGRLFATA